MIKVVLFDFHFTLAKCNCQLNIEVRGLPRLVLQVLADRQLVPPNTPALLEKADTYYQELRAEMSRSGKGWLLTDRAIRIIEQLGYDVPAHEVESVIAEIMDACLPYVEIVPGADLALEQLSKAGFALGVVSTTGYPQSVVMGLERLGLHSYFSRIITSGGEGIHKSNPEIYRRAVNRFDVTPAEAVHIGDQPVNDIFSAKGAGLLAIWFRQFADESTALFSTSEEEDSQAARMADAIVNNFADLPATIERLDGRGSQVSQ